MDVRLLQLTYIGGPTALLELGRFRLLTDPTFDPAGGEYPSGPATLRKLSGPAINPAEMGSFDHVLLSHDHHFDNLDRAGRALLANAKSVLTTQEGAGRLAANSIGLQPWQSVDLSAPDGSVLRVVSTPARHGPHGHSHLGAACVPEVGPFHLTMTAEEAVQAAGLFAESAIVPLHFEGWAHFSEGRLQIRESFAAAGLEDRLHWPEPGRPIQIRL